MMETAVTESDKVCAICGRPTEAGHHLIFGSGLRKLADEDGLILPVCNNCHNMAEPLRRIHDNPMAEKLSKALGQAIYEKEWYRKKQDEGTPDPARREFRDRYGRSYL